MKFLAISALLVAAVLGAPAKDTRTWTHPTSNLKVRNTGDQGDGYYFARFDESGTATVQFTPWEQLNHTASHEAHDLAAREFAPTATLSKRGKSTCSQGTGVTADMDAANIQLANNAQAHGAYVKHAWGWVRRNGELSFFCNYQQNTLTYSVVINFQIIVSNDCGGSNHRGYHRCTNQCFVNDAAIGRTWNGDEFCAKGFHG